MVWVVGDEAILRSDIEMMRLQGEQEGYDFGGDPDCRIPEQLAVQKLFLHQAAIDSIEVSEAEVSQVIDQQINAWIQMAGSREKLEDYRKQSITKMRQELHDDFKNRQLVQKMREKLVEDVKVTPADVKAYFRNMPEDSIPFVPTEVEVQIITSAPRIPIEDINKVKDDLRDYTERVTTGKKSGFQYGKKFAFHKWVKFRVSVIIGNADGGFTCHFVVRLSMMFNNLVIWVWDSCNDLSF